MKTTIVVGANRQPAPGLGRLYTGRGRRAARVIVEPDRLVLRAGRLGTGRVLAELPRPSLASAALDAQETFERVADDEGFYLVRPALWGNLPWQVPA